jgi:hypothetical protein
MDTTEATMQDWLDAIEEQEQRDLLELFFFVIK